MQDKWERTGIRTYAVKLLREEEKSALCDRFTSATKLINDIRLLPSSPDAVADITSGSWHSLLLRPDEVSESVS